MTRKKAAAKKRNRPLIEFPSQLQYIVSHGGMQASGLWYKQMLITQNRGIVI